MKLTPAQQQLVIACATAETRTQHQMLSLLLIEGVNYFFLDRNTGNESVNQYVEALEEDLTNSLGLGSLAPPPDNHPTVTGDWEN